MITKDKCAKVIKDFLAKLGVEASDENIIATIHLMNTHGMCSNATLDQRSRNGHDHGINAWHSDATKQELFVYQSKLSEARTVAIRDLSDLDSARQWLSEHGQFIELRPQRLDKNLFNATTSGTKTLALVVAEAQKTPFTN